jgi:hypothetical protein
MRMAGQSKYMPEHGSTLEFPKESFNGLCARNFVVLKSCFVKLVGLVYMSLQLSLSPVSHLAWQATIVLHATSKLLCISQVLIHRLTEKLIWEAPIHLYIALGPNKAPCVSSERPNSSRMKMHTNNLSPNLSRITWEWLSRANICRNTTEFSKNRFTDCAPGIVWFLKVVLSLWEA